MTDSQIAFEITLGAISLTDRLSDLKAQSTRESLSLSAMRLIEILVSTAGDEDGEV